MKIFAILFLVSTLVSEPGNGQESPQAATTMIDLRVVGALFQAQAELSGQPLPSPEEPLSLRDYVHDFAPEIRRRMIYKDGWKNDLLVMDIEGSLLVISSGADQIDRASKLNPDTPEPTSLEAIFGDDIVLIVGEGILNGPASQRERQKRTMADLRSIGTAIESFSIDNNVYPVQERDLLGVYVIEDKLEPIYIRTLPLVDGWGNEFLMWSTEREYVILSLGADGQTDRYYDFLGLGTESVGQGAFTDPDDDIIFANGQFVQWPDGTQL